MPQSPLFATHEKLGAHFTDFGGWTMPLKYGKELEEHLSLIHISEPTRLL